MHDHQDIKQAVRDRYAQHAAAGPSCCGGAPSSESVGCGCSPGRDLTSTHLGYAAADLNDIPEGADLGLGCGNPLAMLGLQEGETVVDLGSGAGIDCFIAAKRVGSTGRVIGVDMTHAMLDRARANAASAGIDNVEFRLGEIEHLPVADETADVIISNCVVNLVPNKQQVFNDAFRVLRPGGRLSVSDMVLLGEVPVEIEHSVDAYVACLTGAVMKDEYLQMIRAAGFVDVVVEDEQQLVLGDMLAEEIAVEYSKHAGVDRATLENAASMFASVRVKAFKP